MNNFSIKIFLILILLIFLILVLPWLIFMLSTFFWPRIPMPEIREAEFPIILEYYINGNHVVYENTMTIRHAGTITDINGRFHRWEQEFSEPDNFQNRGSMLNIIDVDNIIVSFLVRSPAYYMDNRINFGYGLVQGGLDNNEPWHFHINFNSSEEMIFSDLTNNRFDNIEDVFNELSNYLNIRLIYWRGPIQIKNNFN